MEGNSGIPQNSANNNIKSEQKDVFQVYSLETDPCALRVIPSTNYALKGIVNQIQVLFQIKTGKIEEKLTRTPIDLAIVLDRSGSMGGEKIQYSKQAIKQVIENLSVEDKIHFVVYDSTVDVIFEDGDLSNPELLIQQVESVSVRGSTNIGDGLIKAADLLTKYKKEGHTQRIYLFSDGLVNTGLKTHQELFDLTKNIHEKKITTCTFGIGADFDEDLMKGIAEYGNSYYFYIERSDQIEKFVTAALGALLGTIGKDAVLKLRGKNGGIVKRIYGHDLIKGAHIGDIKQNNLKNILAEVEVHPTANLEKEEILFWELVFLPRNATTPVTVSGTVTLENTEKEVNVETQNTETLVALIVQQSADFDSEIIKLLESNHVEEAIQIKKKEISLLESVLERDPTGRIQSLLIKAKKALSDLETQGNSKHMLKEAKYHRNLKRMDSADWLAL